MRISVIGTGYVGLVSGVCLAEKGHEVVCVDNDANKVARITAGESPIYEAGLDELLTRNIGASLTTTTDLAAAVRGSDLSLIAVGTPFDGSAIDVRYIQQVSREIGAALREKVDYHVVVVKSTVVPGTTDDVVRPLLEEHSGKRAGADFGVGMNPEFLREGVAIDDFMNPDRIVLGGLDDRTHDVLAAVYAPFAGTDIIKTNNKTAEMIKYASNSLLATLISFSNEIGNLTASIGGVDAAEVMQGVHLDKRFSPLLANGERVVPASTTYLEAGCGFGGSCFPKDVKALISYGEQHDNRMRLLKSVIDINAEQPQQVLRLLGKHFVSLAGVRIAVLGLAFKPGTDDMRESPAIPVVNALRDQSADIRAYDPVARHEAEALFGHDGITYCESLNSAVQDAQAVLLLTRWDEFQQLPEIVNAMQPAPVLVDGRRMLDKRSVVRYEGIGL
ncbi:MAG: UDP-glucose dehydrogenase family protein [Gammaproteobacteria bacterium]